MRIISVLFALLLAGLTACGPAKEASEEESITLTLFVAASLTDVIQEVGRAFTQAHPEVELEYNFAGSGALVQQIIAAPRCDVFISASEKWMDAVVEHQRMVAETRQVFLSNRLVVIGHAASAYAMEQPVELAELDFKYLALGDPSFVPAGRYAREWLSALEMATGGSVWAAVEERLLLAPDVRAALAQVVSHRDVVGVVYLSDYQQYAAQLRLLHTVEDAAAPAIAYVSATLRESSHPEWAAAFNAFLRSATAAAIFEQYGFVVPQAE